MPGKTQNTPFSRHRSFTPLPKPHISKKPEVVVLPPAPVIQERFDGGNRPIFCGSMLLLVTIAGAAGVVNAVSYQTSKASSTNKDTGTSDPQDPFYPGGKPAKSGNVPATNNKCALKTVMAAGAVVGNKYLEQPHFRVSSQRSEVTPFVPQVRYASSAQSNPTSKTKPIVVVAKPNFTTAKPKGNIASPFQQKCFGSAQSCGVANVTINPYPSKLLWLVKTGQAENLKNFLENRTALAVNQIDPNDGQTLLHKALRQIKGSEKRLNTVVTLLQHGADPSIKDQNNKTALDLLDELKLSTEDHENLSVVLNLKIRNLNVETQLKEVVAQNTSPQAFYYAVPPIFLAEHHANGGSYLFLNTTLDMLYDAGYRVICDEIPFNTDLETQAAIALGNVEDYERVNSVARKFQFKGSLTKARFDLVTLTASLAEKAYREKTYQLYFVARAKGFRIVFIEPSKGLPNVGEGAIYRERGVHALRDDGLFNALALEAEKNQGGVISITGGQHVEGISARYRQFYRSRNAISQQIVIHPAHKEKLLMMSVLYYMSTTNHVLNIQKKLMKHNLAVMDMSTIEARKESLERLQKFVAQSNRPNHNNTESACKQLFFSQRAMRSSRAELVSTYFNEEAEYMFQNYQDVPSSNFVECQISYSWGSDNSTKTVRTATVTGSEELQEFLKEIIQQHQIDLEDLNTCTNVGLMENLEPVKPISEPVTIRVRCQLGTMVLTSFEEIEHLHHMLSVTVDRSKNKIGSSNSLAT